MGLCGVHNGSTSLSWFHEYMFMRQHFILVVGVFSFTDQNRLTTTQQSSKLHSAGEKTVQWGEMKN